MKNILTVTKYTFLEVYRSKLMLGLLGLAIGLVILTYVASEFAYGAPAKVALDVGLGIMSLSNLVIAIFIGATLLSKEIEQRTLYMVISRPISRQAFLLGKILGLSFVVFLNSIVLGFLSVALYLNYGGEIFQPLFLWCVLFSFFEALIVLIFAVLFSLVTNTTLSVIFTIGVFVVGHALNETSKIFFAKASPFFANVLKTAFFLIPNFYRLNLKDFLIYQSNMPSPYLFSTLAYVLLYLVALLLLVTLIFKNKNLD